MSETLTHGMNCAALNPMSESDCTCGLEWRIELQTEQEMHNAWRKRAEEAEAILEKRTPGEDAWLDEIAQITMLYHASFRDKMRMFLRAYRANILSQPKPAQEALCGTAGLAAISMNEATLPTARIAPPSDLVLLPDAEWKSLSPDSQHKLQTWFRLATERLQAILDSAEFDEDSPAT